ncbi:MAG: DUF362 domain-containing protein [Lachnospiraceae bacterium]|nr:DUF362 domain-containing protein [Lachnospiraceae bacterium]
MSLICVEPLDLYDPAEADAAVKRHFSALHVEEDLFPGIRVLIKPNLLSARTPEQNVTTHPELIAAVVRWLKKRGVADITIADSPGGPYRPEALKNVYRTAGLLALEPDARLNYDTSFSSVACPEGFTVRSFNRIRPVVEADYLINMPKLKTHGMVTLTAGIKNLFGTIPGLQKPEMHYRFPTEDSFCHMLLELARSVSPQITLIDGVDAMEGNGPNSGTIRHLGLTFSSRDPFTLDWYVAGIMGLNPESITLLSKARALGLATPDNLSLAGTPASPAVPPFRLPDAAAVDFGSHFPGFLRRPIVAVARRLFKPVPSLKPELCIGCGKCAESCPEHLIELRNGKARFRQKGCISCFCCQEMCPRHAIEIRRIFQK